MIKTASAVALAAALFAGAATAQDRAIGEDSAYRFSNANDRAVRQNSLQMLQLRAAGYYDQIGAGNAAALAGAGGLLGGSAANTNNQFTFIDQSQVTNNCSNTGGGSMTCSRGDNTVSGVNQTSTGNTQDANTTITGNTVENRDNQTTNNTGGN